MSLWPKVREELNTIVNRHFETPEYRQLFSVKLTAARQAIRTSLSALHQKPARLLGGGSGEGAARCEARDLGA